METTTHRKPESLAQSTILLVLSAETALFGTLVMSYIYLRTGGSSVPFIHVASIDLLIASVNTVIFFVSAIFARRATIAINNGSVEGLKTNLMIVLMLGTLFIIGQLIDFQHSGFRIDDSAFGGAFFALISFHAIHVISGMVIMGLNLARTYYGDFTRNRHIAVTVGSWFWYYVVAVWFVLYIVLFLV